LAARFSDLHCKESLTKTNGKLGGRKFPSNRRTRPFFGDVAQDQLNQLDGAWKMAPGFQHLAQLRVQTFDGVGGVNRLSDFVGISEKGAAHSPLNSSSMIAESISGRFTSLLSASTF
jgi:hypothetical protein